MRFWEDGTMPSREQVLDLMKNAPNDEMRQRIKTRYFGILYGSTHPRLVVPTLTEEEAREFVQNARWLRGSVLQDQGTISFDTCVGLPIEDLIERHLDDKSE